MPVIGRESFKVRCIRCQSDNVVEKKVRPPSTADKPAQHGPGYFRVQRTCRRCGFVWEKKT